MRYEAEFVPQAWINDHAIAVDPEGETVWDCTTFVLNAPREWREATLKRGLDHDDVLRTDPDAPAWVRDWSGPFETGLRAVGTGPEPVMAKIKVVCTGHYGDKPREGTVMAFGNNETEHDIVAEMADYYYLTEEEELDGKKVELPEVLTWDWLDDHIESYAWWTLDEFEIEVAPL